MDGHGMRSQERVAHFAQTSESGSEKVRVEQYISGQTFHPVPRQKKYGICFGNFSQQGGGGGLPNSQNFCKFTKSFLVCQIYFRWCQNDHISSVQSPFPCTIVFSRPQKFAHNKQLGLRPPPMCGQCHLFAVLAVFKG